jgi:hypothetical protein
MGKWENFDQISHPIDGIKVLIYKICTGKSPSIAGALVGRFRGLAEGIYCPGHRLGTEI